MGYGVVVTHPAMEAVDYGVIALPSSMSIESRLYQMYTHIHNLIAIFRPDAVAIEDPFVGRGERSFPGSSLAIGQGPGSGAYRRRQPGHSHSQVRSRPSGNGPSPTTERPAKSKCGGIVTATLSLPAALEIDAADALAVGLCHLSQQQATGALLNEIPPGREALAGRMRSIALSEAP